MLIHRITEYLGILEGISAHLLVQPPAKAGLPRPDCTGTWPGRCWMSPKRDTPWIPWAACRNYYRIILTTEVVCKASRKCLNIYYELVVWGNLAGVTTQKNENQAVWSSDQTKTKTLDNHNCLIWNLKEKNMDSQNKNKWSVWLLNSSPSLHILVML